MNHRASVGVIVSLIVITITAGCAPQQAAETRQDSGQSVTTPKRIVAAMNGTTASVYNRLRAGPGTATGGAILGAGEVEQLVTPD